uniref:Uncharacterized protein n=1 Tax=Rhizophora mucronata TaxID=61149 RepID=A0A2P2QY18_RHIMU
MRNTLSALRLALKFFCSVIFINLSKSW